MKKIRRILGVLLTLILLATAGTNVFASETVNIGTGTGSITVTNATEGKIYRLYKLFDATYDGTAVSYTYTRDGAEETDLFLQMLISSESPFTLTKIRDTSEYAVETEADAKTISDWIKAQLKAEDGVLSDGDVLKAVASHTAGDSEIVFGNLAFGYYFVTSTLGTALTIDSNTPDQRIIDKNQGPSWNADESGSGKLILSDSNLIYENGTKINSVNAGDTVTFMIGVNTTNYNGDQKILEYFVNDRLANGFSYDRDSLTVKIGEKLLTEAEGEPAVGSSYSIAWTEENGFYITVPWYDGETERFATAKANDTLTVAYSAILSNHEDTVYAGSGNENIATYDFRDESDPEIPGNEPYHIVEEKKTATFIFALGFTKIDGGTKDGLSGAEFILKDPSGLYITATGADGAYVYSGNTEEEASATVFHTDASGKLTLRGVKEGAYTLIESKAPAGYNALTEAVTVDALIEEAEAYLSSYITYYDANGEITEEAEEAEIIFSRTYEINVAELVIENNKGTIFPGTGGAGTVLIYLVGGGLILAGLILLLMRRRLRADR